MISLEEFQRLKEQVEKLKRERDMAEGAIIESMNELKEEFDCDTIEEAKKLLAKLQKQEKSLEQQIKTQEEEFEEKWGEQLND